MDQKVVTVGEHRDVSVTDFRNGSISAITQFKGRPWEQEGKME